MKIGIWGFGIVGQSIFRYLEAQSDYNLAVYDGQILFEDCSIPTARVTNFCDLTDFLEECDLIYPSPGIDLAPYQKYQSKFRSELDLFYQNWHKPIIAITGSLGKTTLTTLLANVLNQACLKTVAAGNLGLGMCDVLGLDYEQVVLELSSFQLELAREFAPDIAIWTNLYPNHLDRHKTLQAYAQAKAQIFLRQNNSQIALLPISLLSELHRLGLNVVDLKSQIYLFGTEPELNLLDDFLAKIKIKIMGVFILQAGKVLLLNNFFSKNRQSVLVANLDFFKKIETYEINLVILAAVCYLQKVILPADLIFSTIPHRVEKFYTTANQIVFYNDSKSTIGQATLAAVHKLADRPIILFLGGISKGVDRSGLIKDLVGKVSTVICFGAEASVLHEMCQIQKINSMQFHNLELAIDYCLKIACSGDQVLFSPSGASFDLFSDYVQRGECFKKLVQQKFCNWNVLNVS